MYWKLVGTYASEEFANALVDTGVIAKDTEVTFCFEYFNDAVEQGFEEKKLILILYADLLDENSMVFIKQIFEHERIL